MRSSLKGRIAAAAIASTAVAGGAAVVAAATPAHSASHTSHPDAYLYRGNANGTVAGAQVKYYLYRG